MIYQLARKEEAQAVYDVVQCTIKTIYHRYYPTEVVEFFCAHHSRDAILKDIAHGDVSVWKVDGKIVATGSFVENHITRVYVLPEYQNRGYGTQIIKTIEAQICDKYDRAYLDASLPAAALYERLGFQTIKHERHLLENGVVLAYEVMEKDLDVQTMFDRALLAMMTIKDEYQTHIAFYDEKIRNEVLWAQQISAQLSEALRERNVSYP